jgi:hypothetical protein
MQIVTKIKLIKFKSFISQSDQSLKHFGVVTGKSLPTASALGNVNNAPPVHIYVSISCRQELSI